MPTDVPTWRCYDGIAEINANPYTSRFFRGVCMPGSLYDCQVDSESQPQGNWFWVWQTEHLWFEKITDERTTYRSIQTLDPLRLFLLLLEDHPDYSGGNFQPRYRARCLLQEEIDTPPFVIAYYNDFDFGVTGLPRRDQTWFFNVSGWIAGGPESPLHPKPNFNVTLTMHFDLCDVLYRPPWWPWPIQV